MNTPTFTAAELARALKQAAEVGYSVEWIKAADGARIIMRPLDEEISQPPQSLPKQW